MPLLKKNKFIPQKPPKDLGPDDEVFFCEATKEVFKDYDDFFQRTILCNSLVWSCSITGKSGLTYEEAVEAERKAKKRLGTLPKPLKKALCWLTNKTRRGRLADLVDDVYVYAFNRFFKGEMVEAIVQGQWHDCRIVKVIPPSEEEIEKDRQEDEEEKNREEEAQKKNEVESKGEGEENKKKKQEKKEKIFFPGDHLFRYRVMKIEPEEDEVDTVWTVNIECIKREKGTYTREKNLVFLKNVVELADDGNFILKRAAKDKYRVEEIKFEDIFAGAEPKFEESKRLKGIGSALQNTAKSKKSEKSSKDQKDSKDKHKHKSSKSGKNQGTLDSWVKGGKEGKSKSPKGSPGKNKGKNDKNKKPKKQTAAEIEAEMKRFREEMARRTEEAKQKRLEDKAKEKERKKEEAKLLKEVMNEWKKPRDDLLCDDLKELPKPCAVQCKIPNKLFGDFLTLLEFVNSFTDLLETKNSFPNGLTFQVLEEALTDQETIGGPLYDVLSFFLGALFDLQDEEDDEMRVDKLTADAETLDKNVLGKDEDVAAQIKSATVMAQWPMKTQGGLKLRELHMDKWSITEILRLHLQAAGAFRSEKLIMWLYQQRGGYRLSDDPGLHFRMEEPQIIEALNNGSVFELSTCEKMKILNCLMYQILSFATVRDEVDEKYNDFYEAKSELRNHRIAENKRKRDIEEAEKEKRKEERAQKKEGEIKSQEGAEKDGEAQKKKESENLPIEAHLTERQRLAILSKKEEKEREKQKEEEKKRDQASIIEHELAGKVSDLASKAGMSLLGRDRAYRRYWLIDTIPGLFVEHDDDLVGPCLDKPTPVDKNSGPLDEESAMKRVREIMNGKGKSSGDEKASSDKENDQDENKLGDVKQTYAKKAQAQTLMKQKVLSTKNGSVATTAPSASTTNGIGLMNIKEEKPTIVKTETAPLVWGCCLADNMNCPVHSTILPRTNWSYFSTEMEVDSLIESLNPRGIRESDLKDKLTADRDRICRNLKGLRGDITSRLHSFTKTKEEGEVDSPEEGHSHSHILDLTLRDQILELEEKIYLGSLGTLKIRDRNAWQEAIQSGGFDPQCDSLCWGGRSVAETPLQSAAESRDGSPQPMEVDGVASGKKRDSSGSTTARKVSKKLQGLAKAILQVAQMVDPKYFKSPLGEDEKDKKKRLKEEDKKKRVNYEITVDSNVPTNKKI